MDYSKLTAIRDADGQQVFSQADARMVLSGLADDRVRFAIERCAFEDKAEITVTKEIEGSGRQKIFQRRNFSKLSLGQQQASFIVDPAVFTE